jgi:hydroxymethylbilane synthase
MRTLRLGTRGSKLALAQSSMIAGQLSEHHPGVAVELVEIRTSGDRIQDVPLGPSLGQAFFTREIEEALLDGRVDIAVHSCKDLATQSPHGLAIGAVPVREDPHDALVGSVSFRELPAGARIGAASVRRQRFLAAVRPDLEFVDLRGNVPTRVGAVDEGRCDAAILAVAGLRRLGLEGRITETLDADVLLPAAAQGALAIQIREGDTAVREIVSLLDDSSARAEVTAERSCLRRLEAGCQSPVGALGRLSDGRLELRAAIAGPDGVVSVQVATDVGGDSDRLGIQAAEALLARLGLDTLRDASWAGQPPRRIEAP